MRQMLVALSLLFSAGFALGEEPRADNPLTESATWNDIRGDISGDAALLDGSGVLAIAAPYRADDAATVPITIRQKSETPGPITAIKLVIDENPSPLAAEIRFGPAMMPLKFETRVRVDQYSNVRVIADTPQGTYMDGRFVKASGGCSAPATKDPTVALKGMGEMRLKLFDSGTKQQQGRREAQIMIRHPNYSGLQRNQITQLFIGAHFINELEVRQSGELLFALKGGISISENPTFRFSYMDDGSPELTVHALDTEGNVFDSSLPKYPPM